MPDQIGKSHSAFGHDTVIGFDATSLNHDVIQVSAVTFANFAAVQGHMSQSGPDVVISDIRLPRADGITWHASFRAGQDAAVRQALVVVTARRIPGGGGWQQLPAWLPQETAVWTASASWVLAPRPDAIAPVPALR